MADKVTKDDITVENRAGQTVVVVPAGQPVPDDLDAQKDQAAQGGPISQATDEEIAAARAGSGAVVSSSTAKGGK